MKADAVAIRTSKGAPHETKSSEPISVVGIAAQFKAIKGPFIRAL